MRSLVAGGISGNVDPSIRISGCVLHTNAHLFSRRCAQCFRPFPDGVFYEFEGRKYCEHDFHVLFAPCCAKCGKIHKLLF